MVPGGDAARKKNCTSARANGARRTTCRCTSARASATRSPAEVGYAAPGAFVVHFDGHISQLGTFGTLAMGIRRNILEAFVRERISMRVPHDRARQPARDAADRRDGARRVPPPRARHGPLLLPLPGAGDRRPGARAAIDRGTADDHRPRDVHGRASRRSSIPETRNGCDYARSRARKKLEPVFSDPDAELRGRARDRPHRHSSRSSSSRRHPANTRNLVDYLGIEIQAGYLGSCASGRLEDMRIAAQVLNGRQVKPGFALNVVPTSNEHHGRSRRRRASSRRWSRRAPSSPRRAATIASAASPP